ncbi:hypothetical protein SI65_09812 [Aspergillus cristatus]|uniref:Nephrocystin 3-like N-terminal domain-containing protein n=1 Tax=Aspergillus cristatus TaxID=573508 RepID=A0A1E3B1M7_ASPCR|nr:hypothetical protein SI65_09812 [Aspergillus cristatus]
MEVSKIRSGQHDSVAAPLAYFYCARSTFEPSRSNPDEVMRSIVRQLAFDWGSERKVHEIVVTEYERREAEAELNGSDIPRLSVTECVALILDLTNSNPATVVIDALDEVQEYQRHELVQALDEIAKKSASAVKVLMTCRDQVVRFTPDGPKMRIQSSECQDDMNNFVRHHVSEAIKSRRLLGGDVTETLREDLIRTSVHGAKEMFLWVVLQINSLCQMRLEVDVRAAMAKSPSKSLEDFYATAFEKITEGGPGAYTTAMQVFSWLLCPQEPLSPTAFMTVLTMADPDNPKEPPPTLSEILDVCFNLVTFDPELNVRFAHVSVREFLERNDAFSPTGNHRLVAMGCLNICAQHAPSDIGAPLNVQESPYHYAVLYFAEHIRLANLADSNDGLFQALKEFVFCDGEPSLASSTGLMKSDKYAACFGGRNGAVQNENNPPLAVSSSSENDESVARILLAHHQMLDAPDQEIKQAFTKAAASGQQEVLRRFLDSDIDMTPYLHEALKEATSHRHLAMVDMLMTLIMDIPLMAKAPIEDRNAHIGHILVGGCIGGHKDIVSLGLSMVNQDLVAAEMAAQRPPQRALGICHWRNSSLTTTNTILLAGDYTKDLSEAALKRQYNLVEFLVSSPAWRVSITATIEPHSFMRACEVGDASIVRLLLRKVTRDSSYPVLLSEALSVACINGHVQLVVLDPQEVANQEETLAFLLNSSANVNGLGGHDAHPIYLAAAFCPPALVQKFIEKRAAVNLAVADDKKPIYAAARREIDGLAVIELLLVQSSLKTRTAKNSSLAQLSSSSKRDLIQGPGAVVKLLLEQFPHARAAAAYKGNLNIVQQLLSAGADPNLLGGRYDTALRAAVAGGNAEIVDVLIHFAADIYLPSTTDGADPTKGRGDRRPTLVIACRVGKISIIDRLFSAGADVNAHSPRKAEEETSRVRGDF